MKVKTKVNTTPIVFSTRNQTTAPGLKVKSGVKAGFHPEPKRGGRGN